MGEGEGKGSKWRVDGARGGGEGPGKVGVDLGGDVDGAEPETGVLAKDEECSGEEIGE